MAHSDNNAGAAPMPGYDAGTYGRAFADVYDDWYRNLGDVDALARCVDELAPPGPICELGIGTGRVARALADRGRRVTGIDISPDMLERLRADDREGRITAVMGDMVDDLATAVGSTPAVGVVAAYNTVLNLLSADRQQQFFHSVASVLSPDGYVFVEATVPPDDAISHSTVGVRSMTTSTVVLSVARHRGESNMADGHFIEFTDGDVVRLRPWTIRYLHIDEMDAMASAAGLELHQRFADWSHTPFRVDADNHVSIYRRRS